MGTISSHPPVLLILAAFSRHEAALRWGAGKAAEAFGSVVLASDVFEFTETQFYEREMGRDLKKQFVAFERPIDPARLPEIKRLTNDWEVEYPRAEGETEPRPLNLDPGYLTEAKLVLATTKDRDHRLYLGQGIYGEVTLRFYHGQWQARDWTYPDYRRSEYHQFFDACRAILRAKKQSPA